MVELVTGIAVTVGSAFLWHLWETRFRDRVYVRRITSSADKRVSQLVELYGQLFPEEDGTNYSVEEIVEFMDSTFEVKRHVAVENIVLVAMFKRDVVGFIMCHLYPERRKAIVSHFAINKAVREARRDGAGALLTKLKRLLISGKSCEAVFFDLQGIVPDTPKPACSERKARRVLFKQSAKALGLRAREFQFLYNCPRVSLSPGTHEHPFALFCIGIGAPIPEKVPKQKMVEYLRFIYLDCYGDMYPVSDPRFEEHQQHLLGVVQQYEQSLPEHIAAV